MIPFLNKEPIAVSAAVVAVLNVLQLAGIVSLDGNTVSAINIALVAVLGLFVRQNVYSPASTQEIANNATYLAPGTAVDIGNPPEGPQG